MFSIVNLFNRKNCSLTIHARTLPNDFLYSQSRVVQFVQLNFVQPKIVQVVQFVQLVRLFLPDIICTRFFTSRFLQAFFTGRFAMPCFDLLDLNGAGFILNIFLTCIHAPH